jgi:ketosteroid isomerase-like protein
MSRENVEIIQRGWDAFLEEGIEAAAEFYSEDCEIHDPPELPDAEVRRGREGLIGLLRRFEDLWEGFSLTPVEFIDVSEDQVIAVTALGGSGKESGVPLPDTPFVLLYDLKDGRVVRQRTFLSREQAFEAAGPP